MQLLPPKPSALRIVRAVRVVIVVGLVSLAAGCGSGGLQAAPSTTTASSTPTPDVPSATPNPTPVPTVARTATPSPTEVPGPPEAGLGGVPGADADVLGALGTFTWDGLTSDAPLIVPSRGQDVAPGTPLVVTFVPARPFDRWEAAWAPVRAGEAGDPVPAGDGTTDPIILLTPARAGVWSLRVQASFGGGNHGSWFWRVQVAP